MQMKQNWNGRYEELINALVRFGNVASRNNTLKRHYEKYGIDMSAQEWQVLSFLVEHPDQTYSMAAIAANLGIATSTMTKYTSSLEKNGLVEKCKMDGNKKNIVLTATKKGNVFYEEAISNRVSGHFSNFFDILSTVPDSELKVFSSAIDALSGKLPVSEEGTKGSGV